MNRRAFFALLLGLPALPKILASLPEVAPPITTFTGLQEAYESWNTAYLSYWDYCGCYQMLNDRAYGYLNGVTHGNPYVSTWYGPVLADGKEKR